MAVVNTTTVTVNAAFLGELKEVNEELWQLLAGVRRECAALVHGRDTLPFVEMLTELRDQLALHFALEEAYGYFEDPLFVAPRLCQRASRLRDQHRQLYVAIVELCERVEEFQHHGRMAFMAGKVAEQFQRFDDQLQDHEAEERELILQAYDDDIGVGD